MLLLTLSLGALVGFSLGLTGGGGSAIFAVPLLVYGLGVPTGSGWSFATDGGQHLTSGLRAAGVAGYGRIPDRLAVCHGRHVGHTMGSWLADRIPEAVLLSLFAMLMLVIAVRMWTKARDATARLPIIMDDNAGPTCRRDPEGKLRITSPCKCCSASLV